MKALHDAYKELFGNPDTMIRLSAEDGTAVFELAVSNPIPDEDLHDSSITSIGLSAMYDTEVGNIEFFTEIKGNVSNEIVSEIGEAYFELYELLAVEDTIIHGSIYRSVAFSPFNNMHALMIVDKGYLEIQWLDEGNEKGRLIRVIPIFEQEADELEQFPFDLREKMLIKADIPYTDPARNSTSVAYEAWMKVWKKTLTWYEEHHVAGAASLKAILENASIADNAADALEQKLAFKLPADFKASFNMIHGEVEIGPFTLLNEDGIIRYRNEMIELNNNGDFETALEKIVEDDRVQQTWWHEKWLPVAADLSTGDILFLDMSPGPDGVAGQVVVSYVEEGPIATGHDSFFDYINNYNRKLNNGEYKVSDSGYLIEI